MTIIVDVFPIAFDFSKYSLSSFGINGENVSEIGATFAARIRKMRHIPCAFVKAEGRLVVPSRFTIEEMTSLLTELQQMKLEGFDSVYNVYIHQEWQPSAEAIAQFVAIGVLEEAKSDVKTALKKEMFVVKDIMVGREHSIKGIVVSGQPALQISVHSPLNSTKKLVDIYNPQQPNAIQGRLVKCKDTVGNVESIVGKLIDHRLRLISYEPTDYNAEILKVGKLPDDSPVVKIKPAHSKKAYDYPISVLSLVVDFENLKQFGLNQDEINKVTSRTKISPLDRNKLITTIKESLSNFCVHHYSAIHLGNTFNSETTPDLFVTSSGLRFNSQLCFGKELAFVNKDTEMIPTLKQYGLYRKSSKFEQENKILIGVLDATGQSIENTSYFDQRNVQLGKIKNVLQELGFEVERAADPITVSMDNDAISQRTKITRHLKDLIKKNPHIILLYLPQVERYRRRDEPLSLYNIAKGECIAAGIASQIIFEQTVQKADANDNIIMGILGKIGNIPYVLAEELEYTDLVVGLDVSRTIRKNGSGTDSTAAMSRIYTNQGAMLGYSASSASVAGEIIPPEILERILPESEFGGKRVIVHRDGRFVGDELSNILEWGESISATFLPIEITKSGAGRMYKQGEAKHILQCDKGSAFALTEKLAYLVSSPPPSGRNGASSTAQPLQINNLSNLTLYQALHSVLALTLLHYGSVRQPRLPVSTHASDKIAGFLRRNIRPDRMTGDVPFWL